MPETPESEAPGGPIAVAERPGNWELDRSDPTPTRAAHRPGSRPGSRPGLRPLLLRLHFYAGILVAPFLVIAAVTGLLYALTPQLDAALYGGQLHAASSGGPTLPLDRQVAAARAAHPEGTIAAVLPAADPGRTTQVVPRSGSAPSTSTRTPARYAAR
jgi:uncharacterized iron-regulated membrane protein